MQNLVTQGIPPAILAEALKMVRDARAKLAANLISLTEEERHDMPKMGAKSLAFVTQSAEYGQSLAGLMPPYLNVADLVIDASVSNDLLPLFLELLGFLTDVESTRMEAGSEGYVAALAVFEALKQAARKNQPGAQAAVSVLEVRFAGQGKRKPKIAPAGN